MCKRETFKQLAGEQCKVIVVHEPVNIHTLQSYITVSLCGIMDTQWCVKVSSACGVATGVATGGLCRPAHLNSTEIKV